MAITGLIWVGYVFLHMYGNTKVFFGRDYFNAYAEGLRTLGAPIFGHLHLLIIARIVLVVSVVLHVWAALTLTRQAQVARPTGYKVVKRVKADYASLTMRYGGVAIFFFLLYHLAHLTWGAPGINSDFIRGDAYHNLVLGFQNPINVILYLIALVALGLHLYHGVWSMFQTLGLNSHEVTPAIRALAWFLALVVPIGFATVPIAVILGIVA